MIKYRLRFKYLKENLEKDRENNINEILSDIDTIESDVPIRKPLDGEIILVSDQEYKVETTTISFVKDGDNTYYDFIVSLKRNVKYVPNKLSVDEYNEMLEKKMLEEKMRKLMGEKIRQDKYDKYNDYYKQKTIL